MKKILIPTELTYLSRCAMELGLEVANRANAAVEVLSVVETRENLFIEKQETYHNAPASTIKNIQLTEVAREKLHQRVEEIAQWLPNQSVIPKVLYGDKVEVLLEEVQNESIDLVIMGGDLYDPADKRSLSFLRASASPVLVLKCMLSELDQFKDIIFLTDVEQDSEALISHLKQLQQLLGARLHVVRINTPRNFLSFQKCTESLEAYIKRFQLKDTVLVSKDAKTEKEGLLSYCETIKNAFVATAVHERSFLRSLLNNQGTEGELITDSVHPIWMYGH